MYETEVPMKSDTRFKHEIIFRSPGKQTRPLSASFIAYSGARDSVMYVVFATERWNGVFKISSSPKEN